MRNSQLLFGGVGKALEQNNLDRLVPERIDERLVREHGVGGRRFWEGE